jgi:hypothetical protein
MNNVEHQLSDRNFVVHNEDCIEHMFGMPAESVDFSVFSPPFPSVFSYGSSEADIGNSEDLKSEARIHFRFFFKALLKVMKPGRVVILHCQQIINMKRSGGRGMFDFRGLLIRLGVRAGFTYDYDWLIRKGPQAQAIRTKSRSLQFSGLEADRANSRGAMCDYLIKFIAPGDNAVPIQVTCMNCGCNEDSHTVHETIPGVMLCDDGRIWTPDLNGTVTRNEWIDWAEGAWTDIRETDTLNTAEAKSEGDVKHICALQLSVIRRAVRLFSNPREVVFSPFAGIGSEGFESIKHSRRFYGCELKKEYYDTALNNLARAELLRVQIEQPELFASMAPVIAGGK